MSIPKDEFIAPACHEKIEILYEDSFILVINKPSGLLSLSGKHPLNKDSVHYRLVQDYPTALMVHRLDFGTSGVMVIALSKDMVKKLNHQFSERQVTKTYQALLVGILEADEGEITAPIAKGDFPYQVICHKTGKSAKTHYQVLSRDVASRTTRVEFTPHTGRTHQLRVHSAFIGSPIVGCDLYGGNRTLSSRMMLHAQSLEFEHPMTGKGMVIHSLCPF